MLLICFSSQWEPKHFTPHSVHSPIYAVPYSPKRQDTNCLSCNVIKAWELESDQKNIMWPVLLRYIKKTLLFSFEFVYSCWLVSQLDYSSQHLALYMVILGLCAAARTWKPISWPSRRTLLVLMLLPEAVWNSVVCVATEDRLFLCPSALCGPVLSAFVAYHFVAEQLLLLDVSTSQ